MRIEILDKYRDSTVVITTPDDDSDKRVNPTYNGESPQIGLIKRTLSEYRGAYGHIVDPSDTTNLDLQVAAQQLPFERFTVSFSSVLAIRTMEDGRVS